MRPALAAEALKMILSTLCSFNFIAQELSNSVDTLGALCGCFASSMSKFAESYGQFNHSPVAQRVPLNVHSTPIVHG